jgi:alkanesulfonate monooxygenase SsuD/methylene tetrahydromethanopterin reductase-like flavin-dependent oxidoreductase (luciferase family)
MTHPHRELTFGSFLFPKASEGPDLLKQASLAEDLGFDLIGVPDHVDWGHYVDEWVLMSAILGRTNSIEVFSCVTSLALREPPAVIAKAAASLDSLAPGRFHFGLGSGVMPGIATIGGPLWQPEEAFERVREAIELTRVMWSGRERGAYSGRYYRLEEAQLPPAPSQGLDIWVGCIGPRMRRLVAKSADGWIPGMFSVDPDVTRVEVEQLDEALDAAGRPRGAVRRVYNTIAKKVQPSSEGFLVGPADQWVEQLTQIALEFGYDTFLFGDRNDTVAHLHRLADEIIPQVRANVASALAPARPVS